MTNTVDIAQHWATAPGAEIEIKESKIPFKTAPDWANYYVRNCDGSVTYFEHQPSVEWQHYYCNTGRSLDVDTDVGYTPGWRKTIRKRP